MNFPDLETCKAVSSEFPDSGVLWVNEGDGTRPKLKPRSEVDYHSNTSYPYNILANAPNCEELGVWLKDKFNKVDYKKYNFKSIDILIEEAWSDDKNSGKSETQLRVEAVKLILGSQTQGGEDVRS